jgi:hypothetical protein
VELEEHLFRRESGRLVAILTRLFGVHNLSLAEDVVQDAFCRALEDVEIPRRSYTPPSTRIPFRMSNLKSRAAPSSWDVHRGEIWQDLPRFDELEPLLDIWNDPGARTDAYWDSGTGRSDRFQCTRTVIGRETLFPVRTPNMHVNLSRACCDGR